MNGSAAGIFEVPDRNGRDKSGLNRSILDQGWGMFIAFLRYKQAAPLRWPEDLRLRNFTQALRDREHIEKVALALSREVSSKLDACGGALILVAARNYSRMCPECGHVSTDNRYVKCGFSANADLVGVIKEFPEPSAGG